MTWEGGRGGFRNVKINKRTLGVFSRTLFMFFFSTCQLGSFGFKPSFVVM